MANRTKVYKSQRNRFFKRDGMRCHYCKLTVSKTLDDIHPRYATVDHMTPLSRGGSRDDDNLVCACRRCNNVKGNMPYDAFLWYRHMVVRGENPEDLLAAVAIVFGEVSSRPGDCVVTEDVWQAGEN